MCSENDNEDKVVFDDGGSTPRVYRGKIITEDANFVTLRRRDGDIKISTGKIYRIYYARKR